MKRILLLCSVLLLFSACVMADIGMPNDHVYSIGTFGNYSMGISVMGLPNGNMIIKVYRDVCPNSTYPNASTSLSALSLKISEIVPADPVQTGQPLHAAVVKTFGRADWISSATMPFQIVPSFDTASGYTSECSWAVDAFQWRSYQYHNATWRIEATSTGSLALDGTINTLPLTVTKDIATNNLVVEDLSMPHFLVWGGEAGSPHPIASFGHTAWGDDVRDGGPLTATSGTVSIYSAATGNLVRTLTVPTFNSLPSTPINIEWDGRDGSGAIAPRGFYSYEVTLQHVEKRWSFPTGDPWTWPNWRPLDCTTGTRNLAGILAYDKDTDHSLSNGHVSNVAITQPAGGGYDINWTVSPGKISTGVVEAFRRSDLSKVDGVKTLGASQHLNIPDDAYYFLVYGYDRGDTSKDHYPRQMIGRSYSVGLGAPTVAGPTSPTCQAAMTFVIAFKDNVTGLTASGINVTGGTKGALDTISGSTYALHVTASGAGTVTCQVPAHVAQASNGYWNTASSVASVTYTPPVTLATPTFSPPSGDTTFPCDITVTSDSGSAIHYTLNGADPTEIDPSVASGGTVHLTTCSALKARAYKSGCFIPSAVAAADYLDSSQITVGSGTDPWEYPLNGYFPQSRTQSIYLAGELAGASTIRSLALDIDSVEPCVLNHFKIRMKHTSLSTFDGGAEFDNSGWTTVYSANENVNSTGWKTFTFTTPFNYDGVSNMVVDISYDNNTDYGVNYTYCSYFTPADSRTLCCLNAGAGDPLTWTNTGSVVPYVPNIRLTRSCANIVAQPTITPDGGPTGTPFSVTMGCATSGATIFYTTDGTEPTDHSTMYTGSITLPTCPVTVKARAYKAGMVRSSIKSASFYTVPLTVTIDQAAGQDDPTATQPINFTVVFSEPVNGFDTGDVVLSGTGVGAATEVTTDSGDHMTFNVAVSDVENGTVIATIPYGVCVSNAFGQANDASTSTDNVVTYYVDTTRPTVTINQASTQSDPAGAQPIDFTVVFSEPVFDFSSDDISIGGTARGEKGVTVTGSGATYNVAVSNETTLGTVTASIPAGVCTDANGNTNIASTSTDNTVTYQPDAPENVLCVKGDTGNDANDGRSWTRALATVQRALELAPLMQSGDYPEPVVQIWVAAGTYGVPGGGTFELPHEISLLGGFAGVETAAAQRDWRTYETVLQGVSDSSVVTAYSDDIYYYHEATVDGFTISGGSDGAYVSADDYCAVGLTISHSNISGNLIGVVCTANGTVSLTDNKIDDVYYGILLSYCLVDHNTNASQKGSGTKRHLNTKQEKVSEGVVRPMAEGWACYVYNNVITGAALSGIRTEGLNGLWGINNTIVGNRNGVEIAGDDFFMANNIVAFNTVMDDEGGIGISCQNSDYPELISNCVYANETLDYDGIGPGIGDISPDPADPMFVDRLSGNYHLVDNSPCVDAGNDYWQGEIDRWLGRSYVDFDGYAREACWAYNNVSMVDMGAYEVQPVIIKRAASQPDQTSTLPINFAVTFSRPVTGFETGDVQLGGTGANSVTQTITGSGKTYNLAVSGLTRGTVAAWINPNVCTDLSGTQNPSQATPCHWVDWGENTVNYQP